MPNRLRIDMSQTFGYRLALEVTSWDHGVSWINDIENQRFVNHYHEDKGLSLAWLSHKDTQGDWRRSFPAKVLQALLDFEQHFHRHTFSCLWFVSRSEAAQQLLLSSPILLWLVVDYAKTQQLKPEQVWSLFSIKRTQILALHGLPPTKSALKLLLKYPSENFDYDDVVIIHNLCQQISPHLLGRLNYINRSLASWILDQPSVLKYPFIYHLNTSDTNALRTTLRDTIAMGAELNRQRTEQLLQNCQTPEQLYALHDEWIAQFNRHQIHTKKNTFYPLCDLEQTESIIQIKTAYELMEEGKEMNHCIASYHKRILCGEYLAFKVMEPERATLGLHYVRGELTVDQLRLKRNGSPSKETEETVYWWLQNQK